MKNKDKISNSFAKIKQDINDLKYDLYENKVKIDEIRLNLIEICELLKKIPQKIPNLTPTHQTDTPQNKTHNAQNTTHKHPFKPLKHQNMSISTGNGGVPTDRQTDRHIDTRGKNPFISHGNNEIYPKKDIFPPKLEENDQKTEEIIQTQIKNKPQNSIDSFENARDILDSLDNIKKEIRLKFKRLTEKEILVFSILYQFDEEQGYADYKMIADKLNLTESSIRDYIGRIIKKGIPVDKNKINNKTIQLSVSKNLKEIASLSTILKLRDI